MKNYVLFMVLIAVVLSPVMILADGLPGYLVVKPKERGDFQSSTVLYPGESFSLALDTNIVGNFSAQDFDRDDLYAVRFLNVEAILPQLKHFGQVLYISPDQREVIMSLTDEDKRDNLAGFLHAYSGTMSCGSILKLMSPRELMNQPATVKSMEAEELIENLLNAPVDTKIKQLVDQVQSDNIRDFVEKLSAFKNRYHRSSHGQQSTDFIYNTFAGFAKSNPALTVQKVAHSNTPQPSVVATLKGTTLPDEIVIVGCHIDSINGFGSGAIESVAPGADDNASGTSSVKEILRVLAGSGQKFKRTIEFHGYAAEEIGLVGSANIAGSYKSAGKKVVGMVQIDMNLFVRSGSNPTICIVTNDTDSQHNELAKRLTEQYTSLQWKTGQLFAGTSDHRSWTQRGYRAIFPFEDVSAHNGSIHTINDTFAKSGNLALAKGIAQLALAYLASIAEPN